MSEAAETAIVEKPVPQPPDPKQVEAKQAAASRAKKEKAEAEWGEKRRETRESRLQRAEKLAKEGLPPAKPVGADPHAVQGELSDGHVPEEKKAEAEKPEDEKPEVEAEAAPAEDEKKAEPVEEDKLVKAANDLIQELKENPEVARPILTKLLKQGITGTYIEINKRTKQLNSRALELHNKEQSLNSGHAALGKERESFEKEKAEWGELRAKQPREFARRVGLTLRDFADEAMKNDEPEEKRKLREIEERYAADSKRLEEERAAEKKKLEDLETRLAQRDAAELERQDRAWVSSAWETRKADYPYLVAYDSSQILDSAYTHLKELHTKGELDPAVDRERVFAKMNQWAEAQKLEGNWTEAQLKRFAQANPTPVAKAGTSERANGQAKANPAASQTPPAKQQATLSNTDAAERASPPRAMSRKEKLEHAVRRFAG